MEIRVQIFVGIGCGVEYPGAGAVHGTFSGIIPKLAPFHLALVHDIQNLLRISLECIGIKDDFPALGTFVSSVVHYMAHTMLAEYNIIAVAVLTVFLKGFHVP